MKLFYQNPSKASFRFILLAIFLPFAGIGQQAVTSIVTDYNSYWKTSASAVNAVKPANSHNLLAFTYNGTQYSTGVNDAALSGHGESFTAGDFWALPVDGLSNALTSNTKIGLGEMYDGVHNGASNPAPTRDINTYLTDGVKGLNIGTCIANLPAGTITFLVNNIRPQNIGDGIPDIIVTQVADPSGTNDKYSFVDQNGVTVGQMKEIIFSNIPAIGNWTADFYEASTNPMTLSAGFTNTDRQIRVWAADLSDFGITSGNQQSIKKFKITLAGNSDVAFVAYNNRTMSVSSLILPVTLNDFSAKLVNDNTLLSWKTASEKNSLSFVIEKSTDNRNFRSIDSVMAKGNSVDMATYTSIDKQVTAGVSYYRLRMLDRDGHYEYSKTVQVQRQHQSVSISVFPNPTSDRIVVQYPAQAHKLQVFDTRGHQVRQLILSPTSTQATVDVSNLPTGSYYLVIEGKNERQSQSFIVQ